MINPLLMIKHIYIHERQAFGSYWYSNRTVSLAVYMYVSFYTTPMHGTLSKKTMYMKISCIEVSILFDHSIKVRNQPFSVEYLNNQIMLQIYQWAVLVNTLSMQNKNIAV